MHNRDTNSTIILPTHVYFPDCINLSQLCNCKKIEAGEMTGWLSHLELEPICWVHSFLLLEVFFSFKINNLLSNLYFKYAIRKKIIQVICKGFGWVEIGMP